MKELLHVWVWAPGSAWRICDNCGIGDESPEAFGSCYGNIEPLDGRGTE